MTRIARCPSCSKELGVPSGTLETASVRCPLCDFSFKLHKTYPGNLPKIIVENVKDSSVQPQETTLDSENAANPLFSTMSSHAPIETKKNRTAPVFAHLIGILFFGIVGLALGLGVLCFLGKADPVLDILPNNEFINWLEEVNASGR